MCLLECVDGVEHIAVFEGCYDHYYGRHSRRLIPGLVINNYELVVRYQQVPGSLPTPGTESWYLLQDFRRRYHLTPLLDDHADDLLSEFDGDVSDRNSNFNDDVSDMSTSDLINVMTFVTEYPSSQVFRPEWDSLPSYDGEIVRAQDARPTPWLTAITHMLLAILSTPVMPPPRYW